MQQNARTDGDQSKAGFKSAVVVLLPQLRLFANADRNNVLDIQPRPTMAVHGQLMPTMDNRNLERGSQVFARVNRVDQEC